MGIAYSNRFTVTVIDAPAPGPFTPPYSLPSAGQVVAIGTNYPRDISPTPTQGMTNSYNYSFYALFHSFSGGAFVEDYSAGGAFVICSSGGHSSSDNVGAAIFDFADATWKRKDPADGPNFYRSPAYTYAETTKEPYFEIPGTTIPAPCHTGLNLVWVPKTKDGSNKGSVMRLGAVAVTGDASLPMFYAHKFDLDTGIYTRPVIGPLYREQTYACGLWDADRNRWWHLGSAEHTNNNLEYVDAADWTVKYAGGYGYPVGAWAAGGAFMHQGLIIRNPGEGTAGLCCYDPSTPSVAPFLLNVDVPGNVQPRFQVKYELFHGKFYSVPETAGNTADYTFLYRLTPPASNPKTNQWIADTVTIPAIPSTGTGNESYSVSYNRLFYNRLIDRLCWIPGDQQSVYLIYPT